GFLRAFTGDAGLKYIWSDSNLSWNIGETYLKQHGGCRGNHAAVDAVTAALMGSSVDTSSIENIRISVDSVTFAAAMEPPKTAEETQFSIAFSVAVKLLKGDVFPARFTDSALHEPAVQRLMKRIHVDVDPSLDENYPHFRPAVAIIRFKDGSEAKHRVDYAKGEPEDPLSAEHVTEKFQSISLPVLGNRASKVQDTVMNLENIHDVST